MRWANERPELRRAMLRSWIRQEFGIAIGDQDVRRDRDGKALESIAEFAHGDTFTVLNDPPYKTDEQKALWDWLVEISNAACREVDTDVFGNLLARANHEKRKPSYRRNNKLGCWTIRIPVLRVLHSFGYLDICPQDQPQEKKNTERQVVDLDVVLGRLDFSDPHRKHHGLLASPTGANSPEALSGTRYVFDMTSGGFFSVLHDFQECYNGKPAAEVVQKNLLYCQDGGSVSACRSAPAARELFVRLLGYISWHKEYYDQIAIFEPISSSESDGDDDNDGDEDAIPIGQLHDIRPRQRRRVQ